MAMTGFGPADTPLLPRLATLGVVLLAHLLLAAWLLALAPAAVVPAGAVRMDVRLIRHSAPPKSEMPAPEPAAAPVVQPAPAVQPPLPPAPRPSARPVAELPERRRPEPQPQVRAAEPAVPEAAGTASDVAPAIAPPAAAGAPAIANVAPALPEFVAARFDADYLSNPAPAYPPMSRRRREEGQVLLAVSVGVEGAAEQVEIHESSGFRRLDEAALQAVRRWRFVPAQREGRPVAAQVVVPIIFRLETGGR